MRTCKIFCHRVPYRRATLTRQASPTPAPTPNPTLEPSRVPTDELTPAQTPELTTTFEPLTWTPTPAPTSWFVYGLS